MASLDDLRRFVGGAGVPGDMTPILKAVGEAAVSHSQAAFEEQEFDGKEWPERYPNQMDPKINVAGSLLDLNKGGEINARRFNDRPAGVDSGEGWQSIAWQQTGFDSLEVGSPFDYMSRLNFGGESEPIPIGPEAREGFADLVKQNRGYAQHVGWMLARRKLANDEKVWAFDEYTANVAPRPFIGTSKQFEKDMAEIVVGKIEGRF